MTIVETARLLYARVEIGQNRADLFARFAVSQDFENLDAVFTVQMSASTDLSANTKIHHLGSAEAYAHSIVRAADSVELYGHTKIKHPASAELYGYFYRGGESFQDLYSDTKIQHSDSTELYGKLEVEWLHGSANLYSHFNVRHSASQALYAIFDVGQDDQELFARFEVGQNAENLPGIFELVNVASQELYGYVGITHSIELYGKFIVTRQGYALNLPAFFLVGQNYADLFSSMISQQLTQANLDGELVVRHSASIELYGHAIIKNTGSVEAYAHLVIKNTASQDLLFRFHIGDVRDLFCKFVTGVKDSVVVLAIDNLTGFLTCVVGIGEGFISEAQVEDDGSEKMVGLNSFKITSNYEAGGYKEIKFGWKMGGFLAPAPAYANVLGEIWMLDVGGYLTMVGQIGLYVDDPEGWGGAYFYIPDR